MKTTSVFLLFLALASTGAKAQIANGSGGGNPATAANGVQVPAATPFRVVERGANHRVWQRETYEPGPNGKLVAHVHKFKELATGMHYQQTPGGPWVESQELIEAFPGGAVARQGAHQVIFANNLNTAGSIEVRAADGKRLRSNIIGLAYYDRSTGTWEMIAETQDSQGQLISANEVLYPNAFSGVSASVKYTYKRGSFEQDVILLEQPPTPAGMNPATTELEVLTEFLKAPPPQIKDHPVRSGTGTDQDISWGAARLGSGRAFDLGAASRPEAGIRVTKQYATINGRTILIETVPYNSVRLGLAKLPLHASLGLKRAHLAAKQQALPVVPVAKPAPRPMKLAASPPPKPGYVIDYLLLETDQGDTIFQGDTTYLISGGVNLVGDATIEGGAVIKYNVLTPSIIQFWGNVICATGPYHPAVFTSQNDATVGENICVDGPMEYCQAIADGCGHQIHDVRVSYAQWAVHAYNVYLTDCQFVNCQYPITCDWGAINLTNILMVNVGTAFYGAGYTAYACQLTVNGCSENQLSEDWASTDWSTVLIENSLLVNVGDDGAATITTNYTARLTADSSTIFQTVGAGSGYLAAASPYRHAGTTNVDPMILVDIATKTTYPPLVQSNLTFSAATNFGPWVPLDNTGTPDLGFHYPPLDYVFGGVNAYANVTFSAGTAVGWFELPGSGGAGYGISIFDNVVLAFNGTASLPCTEARYDTVQEGGNGLWTDKGWLAGIAAQSLSGGYGMDPANAAEVQPNFTRHTGLAGDPAAYRDYNALLKVAASNSEFWTAGVGCYWEYLNFTNCLFDRSGFGITGGNPAQCWMRNCTLHGGSLALYEYGQTWPVWIEECAFDGTALQVDDNSGGNTNYTYCDFNAFLTNGDRLPVDGLSHDVTNLVSFNWQCSWFGNYYLPADSPLIDHGSTTADKVGLYHFTTQTNQVPEGTSFVDLGYHYVATDANGNPLDTNGDGIPDYLEDANGNGVFDAGDLGNWLISPYNGLSSMAVLQVYTPLK